MIQEMASTGKTKRQLIQELAALRRRVAELEKAETERKQAEEQIQYLAQLIANVSDAVIASDERFVLTFWNLAAERMYGWKAEEVLGRNEQETLRSEFMGVDRSKALQTLVETGEFRGEIVQYRKDGKPVYVEATAIALKDRDGHVTGYVSVNRSITEDKLMEKALRKSEKKYTDLADLLPQTVFELDEAGNFTFLNLHGLDIFGHTLENPDKGWNVLQMFIPDDRERAKENIQRVLNGENLGSAEYTALGKDSSTFPIVVYTSLIIEENNVVGLRGIVVDITDRKQAEETLRKSQARLAEAQRISHLGNWDWDIVRNELFWSDEVYRIFGLEPQEFRGTYEAFLNSVHPDDRQFVQKSVNEALYEAKPYSIEHRIVLPNGSVRIVHEQGEVTFDESGEPIRMIGTVHDITERKQMQEQLIVTDRLASIGELAAGIAHELNNPLTSVLGFSQLLLDKDVSDDVKQDIKIIYQEAQRTAEVVKNLLTFARKHPPVKKPVNTNSVIEKVLELRAYEQKVNNIQVITHFAPDLPEVMADYFQLQQVFLNIIINAEHFMTEAHHRGTLTITTERVNNNIRASFTDDGPGISKENLGHLFDPFFTTKEVGKGTGLGLSICHGIVTEHGGRIYAESELGKGATFVVELPISKQ